MPLESFTPTSLSKGAVRLVDPRQNFLSNRYFSRRNTHDSNVIMWGAMNTSAHIARYSKTGEASRAIAALSGSLKSVVAPLINNSKLIDYNVIMTLNPALPGYRGPVDANAGDQVMDKINLELFDLRAIVDKTIEVQCAEGLQTGVINLIYQDNTSITISLGYTGNGTLVGDSYTIQPALSGTAAWGKSAADVSGTLEALADQIRAKYDGPLDVVMGSEAFSAFINDEKVQKNLDNRRIDMGGLKPVERAALKGDYNGMTIARYVNSYFTAAGVSTPIWDPKKIVMLPTNPDGLLSVEFGAIVDFKDPGNPYSLWPNEAEYWSQLIAETDPPVLKINMKSAPLALVKDPGVIRVKQVVA